MLQYERWSLTVFSIEADLPLVLLLALQGFVHLLDHILTGLIPMEEVACAHLLHHLCPHKAGQLTEPIWAVHDGVTVMTLSVSQEEITVWMRGRKVSELCCCYILRIFWSNLPLSIKKIFHQTFLIVKIHYDFQTGTWNSFIIWAKLSSTRMIDSFLLLPPHFTTEYCCLGHKCQQ